MVATSLPKRARITAWSDLDQVGRLIAEDGEELKVGRTACAGFVPKRNAARGAGSRTNRATSAALASAQRRSGPS